MDLTFILSAAIFTLLAIVVATSLLNGSSAPGDGARPLRGPSVTRTADAPLPGLSSQNGYVPDRRVKEKKEENWCDISCSSHDHWDVVKSVQTVIRREGRFSSVLWRHYCLIFPPGYRLKVPHVQESLAPFVVHSKRATSCLARKQNRANGHWQTAVERSTGRRNYNKNAPLKSEISQSKVKLKVACPGVERAFCVLWVTRHKGEL